MAKFYRQLVCAFFALSLSSPAFADLKELCESKGGKFLDSGCLCETTQKLFDPSLADCPLPVVPALSLVLPASLSCGSSTPKYEGYEMGWGDAAVKKGLAQLDENKKVPYLNPEERLAHQVIFEKGLVYDQKGQLLGKSKQGLSTEFIYVMDRDGKFYLGSEALLKNHSSFCAGGPVALAGHIKVINGAVRFLSNNSGHYRVPVGALDSGIRELKAQGVELLPSQVEEWDSYGNHFLRSQSSKAPKLKIQRATSY